MTLETPPPDTDTAYEPAEPLFAAGNTNELDALELPARRRWPYLLTGIAIGAAAALLAAATIGGSDEDAVEASVDVALTTAPVEVRDLIEEVEWIGDLTYGDTVEAIAARDGTVTEAADAGVVLSRGDELLSFDNEPVVVMYGELPFWRNLREGDEGPDVELLEENLVALGYDPDGTVTIDEEFTSNTELMVERWQEDIGAEVTGEFELGDAVMAPGPVAVATAATVSASIRTGSVLATLSTREVTTTVVGTQLGTITDVIAVGTTIEHGTVLYAADGVEVVALTRTDPIGELLLDPDRDDELLEATLAFLGYDIDDNVEVDGDLDGATEVAVALWQEDVGLPQTGSTNASSYVMVAEGLQVSATLVHAGDELLDTSPIAVLAAPTLTVVVPVGLPDQDDFFVGQDVQVELPDSTSVAGVVVEVGTIATAGSPDEDPTIDVTIELVDLVDENLPASEVSVIIAGEVVEDALVVPTRALVTLAEGGFAVEVVTETGTVLVAVETGTFDDGVVEVTTSQLSPGDQLVVPQ